MVTKIANVFGWATLLFASVGRADSSFSNGVYQCTRTDKQADVFFMTTALQGPPLYTPKASFNFYDTLTAAQSCKYWPRGNRLPCDSGLHECSLQIGNPPFPKTVIHITDTTRYDYEHTTRGDEVDPPTSNGIRIAE
jgi:hypothetical protein